MAVVQPAPDSNPTLGTVPLKDESRGVDAEETPEGDPSLTAAACHDPQCPSPKPSDAGEVDEQGPSAEPTRPLKKPLSFYLAFLSLLMMVLIVSLDATILAVALPVCKR